MTRNSNILAFPVSRALPVGRHDRSGSLDEAPRLRRPRLLLTAARHGLRAYRRNRDLRRLMQGAEDIPAPGRALVWLTEREAIMDQARRETRVDWDLQTHILLLIAILAETKLAREAGIIRTSPEEAGPAICGPEAIGAPTTGMTLKRANGRLVRLSAV